MTQDWSAFVPDFETLLDNRKHIESETEFDVEQVTEGEKDDSHGKKEISMEEVHMKTNEDAIVDIESLEGNGIYSGEGIRYQGYRFDHLPIFYPQILFLRAMRRSRKLQGMVRNMMSSWRRRMKLKVKVHLRLWMGTTVRKIKLMWKMWGWNGGECSEKGSNRLN